MRQTLILTVLWGLLAFSLPAPGFAVEINWTEHPIVVNALTNWHSVSAVDMDQDWDLDVLAAGHEWQLGELTWWENEGGQNFTPHIVGPKVNANRCFGVDMDADGDTDILIPGAYTPDFFDWRITIWANDGNENFVQHDIASDWTNWYIVYPTDLDDDGDVDVIVGHAPQYLYWLENQGGLNFVEHPIDETLGHPYGVFADDIDGDGDVDVIAGSADLDEMAWWENDGSQNFTRRWLANFANPSSICAADVDSDGDRDLLAVSAASRRTSWFENDGRQNFTERNIHTGGVPSSVFAADLDLDGDIDVLGTNQSNGGDNKVRWWENDGQQNFTEHVIRSNFYGAYSGSAVDLDGDRDLDVLASAYYGMDISWWESDLDPVDIGVIVTPQNPPIYIPRHGGDFSFDWTIINNRDTSVTVDTWTMAIWPDGSYHGPLKLFDSLYVPAQGDTAFYGVNQEVDGSWPGGTYRYLAYVGYYPDTTFDSSYFDFTKLLCLTTWVEPLDTIFRAPLDTLRFDLWVYNCDSLSIPVWGAIQGRAYGCDGGEVVKGPKTRRLASNLQPGNTLYGSFYLVVRYRPREMMSHVGVEILVGPEVSEWVDSTCYVVKVIQPWSPYAKAMGPEGLEILEWGPIEELTPIEALNPTVTSLSRNYPNPFNANTEIIYSLAEAGDVSLTIYNLGGQLIETLVHGHQNTGEYRVIWDASNHSSGLYFYKLTTSEFTETKRMTLLK